MSIDVKIDLSGVKKKLSDAGMKRGKYAMGNQMLADMNRFVPRDRGYLRGAAHIKSNGDELSWTMPYAKAQFYGSINGHPIHHYSTPGTGKRWDLKAKSIYLSSWVNAFKKGAGV